jgi:hypothetical protein
MSVNVVDNSEQLSENKRLVKALPLKITIILLEISKDDNVSRLDKAPRAGL